jgi:hypothetical protein
MCLIVLKIIFSFYNLRILQKNKKNLFLKKKDFSINLSTTILFPFKTFCWLTSSTSQQLSLLVAR